MNFQRAEKEEVQLVGRSESDINYLALEHSNQKRLDSFLQSIVAAVLRTGQHYLSSHIVKALNFHAIAGLHPYAGEYRPIEVYVRRGDVSVYTPPDAELVPDLMSKCLRDLSDKWMDADDVWLAAWILWRINWIHPFVNGNSRTARAACYFALCVKRGGWLPGETKLPDLLVRERERYDVAIKRASASYAAGDGLLGGVDIRGLYDLVAELLAEQLGEGVQPETSPQSVKKIDRPSMNTNTSRAAA